MHLQCFMPTYVRDDHYPICSNCNIGILLALYGSTVHVATLQPYPQAQFSALQCCTLKSLLSVCNTAKLGIELGSGDTAMNLAIQCRDFGQFFYSA